MTGELYWRGVYNPVPALSPAAWYRFNQGITVTGSGVSQWNDASGNARHLLQASDANRPPKQADGSILFDGAADFLRTSNFTLNQPVTIYACFKVVTWTVNRVNWDGNSSGSAYCYESATSPDMRLFAGSALAPISGLPVNTYGCVAAVYNGANSVHQIDGYQTVTGDAGAGNPGGFTLGGDGAAGALNSNIQVKEIAIFSSAHDAATRQSVLDYLSTL